MTELELRQYLLREYPQENARCEWKEFKNLKNSFCGDEKDDVISYVSAIANMEGGFLVVGVHDKTLKIVGTDTYNYDRQKAILDKADGLTVHSECWRRRNKTRCYSRIHKRCTSFNKVIRTKTQVAPTHIGRNEK